MAESKGAPQAEPTQPTGVLAFWTSMNQSWRSFVTQAAKILSWLGIGGAFSYATLYVKPAWAGIWLLAFTVLAAYSLQKTQRNSLRVILWIANSVLFICSLTLMFSAGFRNHIQRYALAHFYSLSAKKMDLSIGLDLNTLTQDRGTYDQIRRIEIQDIRSSKTFIIDEQSAERSSQLLAALTTTTSFRPDDTLEQTKNRLSFFVAPFGSGKETILRQWALALVQPLIREQNLKARAIENPTSNSKAPERYAYVFYISLDADPSLAGEASWQKILAKSYREIVDSDEYYDLLFKREKCLILVSGLDRLDNEQQRKNLLTVARDLASNTTYDVDLIFSVRPETVMRDFAVNSEIRFDRHSRFLRLLDFDMCEWDAYFDQQGLKTVPVGNYSAAKKLIEGDALANEVRETCQKKVNSSKRDKDRRTVGQNLVAAQLATNLEYLNLIVEQASHIDASTPGFYLCAELISRTMERDKSLANEQAFQLAFTNMEQLALKSSLAGTTNLEIDGRISHDVLTSLRGAPLLSIEDGRFVFYPKIVHSYFAVRGLNRVLTEFARATANRQKDKSDPPPPLDKPISEMLLHDVASFAPLPRDLDMVSKFVACSAKKNVQAYAAPGHEETRKELEKIITAREVEATPTNCDAELH